MGFMGLFNKGVEGAKVVEVKLLHSGEVLGMDFSGRTKGGKSVRVMTVAKGSAAERAGIVPGMEILKVEGDSTGSTSQMLDAVAKVRKTGATSFNVTVVGSPKGLIDGVSTPTKAVTPLSTLSNLSSLPSFGSCSSSNSNECSSSEGEDDEGFHRSLCRPLLAAYAEDLCGDGTGSAVVCSDIPLEAGFDILVSDYMMTKPYTKKRSKTAKKHKCCIATRINSAEARSCGVIPGRVTSIDGCYKITSALDFYEVLESLRSLNRTHFSLSVIPTPNFLVARMDRRSSSPATADYVPPQIA